MCLCVWDPFWAKAYSLPPLPEMIVFANSGKCIVLHRWRFFFFLKCLILELAYFCPSNIHGSTEFSSVEHLQVLLLHLVTWGAEAWSSVQADVLQETNLQGVWVTVNSDSSDCILPVLIICSVLCLFLLISSGSPLKLSLCGKCRAYIGFLQMILLLFFAFMINLETIIPAGVISFSL